MHGRLVGLVVLEIRTTAIAGEEELDYEQVVEELKGHVREGERGEEAPGDRRDWRRPATRWTCSGGRPTNGHRC